MSIDSILVAIENLRSLIEKWGISSEALWVAGAVALVLLFFSLREVLTWFLKIQTLAEEMRKKNREFDRIEMGKGGNVQQLILALVNGDRD